MDEPFTTPIQDRERHPTKRTIFLPRVACMQAGIQTLQGADLLEDVARRGIAIGTAVALRGTVRPDADIVGVPSPISFQVLLADHRAGSASLFVYPWCQD